MAAPTTRRRPKIASPRADIEDWLTLVDPDGAFLTTSGLLEVFPQGFVPMDGADRTELRYRVSDLDAAGDPADERTSRADLRHWLLGTVLGWGDCLAEGQAIPATATVRVTEHGATLHPTQVLFDVDDTQRVRLGVFVWPQHTPLATRSEQKTSGDTWLASPIRRAEMWCRESGIPLALVTDDDSWVLVWAPRGAPAASGRFTIGLLADEPNLQAGVFSLLGAHRFFAVSADPESGKTLELLFEHAADSEAELTKGLGLSVRKSVEMLVAAISRADVGVSAARVYESSVTVLMRLVFLLFAEERRLLPAKDEVWAESYSILTLRDELRKRADHDGLDALEQRSTAWYRLLATFRGVHGGINHDRLTLPAYGGALFDPDRFAFFEGPAPAAAPPSQSEPAPGRPLAIDDRTILAILDSLLTVEVGSGRSKVAQRVSYKALDVEQIGYCYEGLLDHGAVSIDELSVGLVGPEADEPELPLSKLEDFGEDRSALCEWLSGKTLCNKNPAALAKLLDAKPDAVELSRLRAACGNDEVVVDRVRRYWGLIRRDLRDLPVVLLPGSMFFTQTSTRRDMGAQYTPKALADEVARYALEPIVYDPGPQNEPDKANWKLKTPAAILDLRVCDPAVGSGAILTAACRFLADRLIESVKVHGPGVGPFGSRLDDLGNAAAEDQTVLARREVVDHCLFGVDKNPLAAEMAKLSLWLMTMARERPFSFLDHAIQVGDALLGITDIDQLRWLHLDPSKRHDQLRWLHLEPSKRHDHRGFESIALDHRAKEATELARQLSEVSVVTLRDADQKQRLHEKLRSEVADLSAVADAVVGAALSTAAAGSVSMANRLEPKIKQIRAALDDPGRSEKERAADVEALQEKATLWLRSDPPDAVPTGWERGCLHWPLAFPEVFLDAERTGFDAIVANPPFLGGKRISTVNGGAYREHLVAAIASGVKGSADLAAFFLLRMCELAGSVGTLATNTLSEGDTREVGLDRLLDDSGWTIHRAVKSEPWPNQAAVHIAKVWLWSGEWEGARQLNGSACQTAITPALVAARRVTGNAKRLKANAGKSFEGSVLRGMGFVLSPQQAAALSAAEPANRDVLLPYLNGEDLNHHPRQLPSRWVINFFDWPIERARQYPTCFEIVERLVKPERSKVKQKDSREKWWIYHNRRVALYAAIAGLDRVLVVTRHSTHAVPAFSEPRVVFSDALCVFAFDDDAHFGLLASALHWWWVLRYASTLGHAIRYTPTDVFQTFPRPEPQEGPLWAAISRAGQALNDCRSDLMLQTGLGLTKTYNRLHDPDDQHSDIETLRQLHIELDQAVRDAYGWSDLPLGHQHWETAQGLRFTVSNAAKDELLDRLLELNHQRYDAEVAAGLHDKSARKPAAKRTPKKATAEGQGDLL